MAKSIKKPISIVYAITQVKGWEILDYQEVNASGLASLRVRVRAYQDARCDYGMFWLSAYNAPQNSLCLFVNPTPTSLDDQLLLGHRALPEAYSRIMTAYHAASGNLGDRLVAIEPVLLATGLLDAAFA